jgi:hypothetical protein
MSSGQVGAVKISRLVEIVVPFPEGTIFPEVTLKTLKPTPWLIPQFVTEDGAIPLSVHALLVETLGKKIIVDTGIGNNKPRHRREAYRGSLATKPPTVPADLGRDDGFPPGARIFTYPTAEAWD